MSAALDTKSESDLVLDRMERLLRRSNAFTLALVKINDFRQRTETSRTLVARFSDNRILEVDLLEPLSTDPLRSLFDELRSRWDAANPPDAIFVYGFEKSIGVEFAPNILRLNNDRELFQRFFPVPLLLWLPDFAIDFIVRGAPDFWAWRSGVFEFPVEDAQNQGEILAARFSEGERSLLSWSVNEKRTESVRLEKLYQEASSLPVQDRTILRTKARFAGDLSTLYFILGDWTASEHWAIRSFDACTQAGDQSGLVAALHKIGRVCQYRGEWDVAKENFERALAIARSSGNNGDIAEGLLRLADLNLTEGKFGDAEELLTRCLSMDRDLGDKQGEARVLNGLGTVYSSRGEWARAEQAYQESLSIFRPLGDRQGEESALHNLGTVYQSRGEWASAEKAFLQSLTVCRVLGDRQGEGQTLNALGIVYGSRGEWDKAEGAYLQSLTIERDLGDQLEEWRALNNLGAVYQSRGEWDKAEKAFQESRAIEQKLGNIPV